MGGRAICLAVNHTWSTHRYPAPPGEDHPEGRYLKCQRCGRAAEGAGLPPGPVVAGF